MRLSENSRPLLSASFRSRVLALGFRLLYGRLAWTYDSVAWIVSLGEWRTWCETALPHIAGCTVLELGHGPGHMLCELKRHGYRPIGIDTSPQMGKLARDRLDRAGHASVVTRGRAQDLPFASASFDSILATFPTDYFLDPRTTKEIARVMAPTGCLIVVLSAQLVRPAPISRVIEWLYGITGQRGSEMQTWIDQFDRVGLTSRQLDVDTKNSRVFLLLARKTTPRGKTGRTHGSR